ncbi:hypothetical protein [Mesorhizobium sp. M7A.F.Ca.CA.004.04.1.1]|nr:hypothetical protein [Mesorhizobium sp. M7A.F.Ca.CA.004.04.1.1]RUY00402.1 hypothetical protein EN985_25325 [Mesorhizobium sp. M7A.F.Ca.CA.004.04.1.1]
MYKTDYVEAFANFNEAVRRNPKFAGFYQSRGIAGFYFGPAAKAQADLEKSAQMQPQDAYSAIWVDLARRRNGQSSILRVAKLDMTKWPAPLVRMLLGDQAPEVTLKAADDPDATIRNEQVCEANFYTAEFQRLQHRDDETLPLYRLVLSDCPKHFIEYLAAINALRSMGKAP